MYFNDKNVAIYDYNEVNSTWINTDRAAIRKIVLDIGGENLRSLCKTFLIENIPTKFSDFYFEIKDGKCGLYITTEKEADFKLIDVKSNYIPRENWRLILKPKILRVGESSIVK